MSDYRGSNFDFRNPDDPFRNDSKLDPNVRAPDAAWGWIAAAVFLVIVLAVAFGAGHRPGEGGTNVAQNTIGAPTAPSHMAPTSVLPPSATPAPAPAQPSPVTPAPSAPAQNSGQ